MGKGALGAAGGILAGRYGPLRARAAQAGRRDHAPRVGGSRSRPRRRWLPPRGVATYAEISAREAARGALRGRLQRLARGGRARRAPRARDRALRLFRDRDACPRSRGRDPRADARRSSAPTSWSDEGGRGGDRLRRASAEPGNEKSDRPGLQEADSSRSPSPTERRSPSQSEDACRRWRSRSAASS